MDVDAGPVIAGHGVAASAFGLGAARKNGRFDRACPLAAELLATVGELPNGVLVVPRLLSNLSDAPMLGEAAILWLLSIQPEKGFPVKTGGSIPLYVFIVLALCFFLAPGGFWRRSGTSVRTASTRARCSRAGAPGNCVGRPGPWRDRGVRGRARAARSRAARPCGDAAGREEKESAERIRGLARRGAVGWPRQHAHDRKLTRQAAWRSSANCAEP